MKDIKKIYSFGSSCTAGGGFEFDSPMINDHFPKLYSKLGEEMTLFNFSWPGQLQKILGESIKVTNLAKQGYGNQRTQRLIYDIVNSDDFDKDETLFLIEVTAMGRDEVFVKDLNDYAIVNYHNIDENNFSFTSIAKDYCYQTKKEESYLDGYNDFFETYITKFKSVKDEMDKLHRSIDFFLNYLEHKSIKYLLTSPPPSFVEYDTSKSIEYGDGNYFIKNTCFIDFTYQNHLTIKDETEGLSEDLHSGFKSNKLVAEIVYNKIVDSNLINLHKKKIDWEYYKKTNIFKG